MIPAGRPLLLCDPNFELWSGCKPIDLEPMSVLATDVELFCEDVNADVELFCEDINVDDQEGRLWLRYAFTFCYFAFLVETTLESGRGNPAEHEDDTGKACRKILMDLREAIGGTCPGDPRYLLLCQKMAQAWRNLAVAAKNTGNTEIYMMSSYVRERAEEQSKKAWRASAFTDSRSHML